MWPFRRKNKTFDDSKVEQFCEAVSLMLEVQLALVDRTKIKDARGSLNPKAIGYIYGFIDAALKTIGQDIGDVAIGIPVTYQVLRRLFPDLVDEMMEFLIEHVRKDGNVMFGVAIGGQQYLDFSKLGSKGGPMGLARFLVGQDDK